MCAAPARMRDDVVRIGRLLMEDLLGEEVLNLGHAQRDAGRAGRRPFFRGVCRARIAVRKACA
jgi:hypothetical protein